MFAVFVCGFNGSSSVYAENLHFMDFKVFRQFLSVCFGSIFYFLFVFNLIYILFVLSYRPLIKKKEKDFFFFYFGAIVKHLTPPLCTGVRGVKRRKKTFFLKVFFVFSVNACAFHLATKKKVHSQKLCFCPSRFFFLFIFLFTFKKNSLFFLLLRARTLSVLP